MKKNFLFLILFCSIFIACKNPVYLPNPNITPDGGRSESTDKEPGLHSPRNLVSSQGNKRSITLKWKPVEEAIRYNVYRAEDEFSNFVQIGETKGRECEFTIKATPGFDMFFRVSAVDSAGKESDFSNIIHSTTLSIPLINNIEGDSAFLDSSAWVSWYMNNADSYINDVYYNVICYDESKKEIQRKQTKGNVTTVLFTDLSPNTNYFYKVEAYNNLNEFEESDIIDAATARRLRPDPVTNLIATQGDSLNTISVSFTLPNFVDVPVEKNVFEPTPLYFKIFRRVYKEGENSEPFKLIKNDFGINKAESGEIDYTTVKFGKEAEVYTPGNVVTFEDNDPLLQRGEKYEYKVQSFAYIKRDVSSDESITISTLPGWLLPESSFETSELNYVKDVNGKNLSASIKFNLAMDTFGIPYKFKIVETKIDIKKVEEPVITELDLGDCGTSVDSVEAINQYEKKFTDLKTEAGYYKYKIVILTLDGIELESHEAVGESLITEQDIPAIGDIKITSGYADKILIEWSNDIVKNHTYKLKYWDAENIEGKEVSVDAKDQSTVIYEDTTAKPGMKRVYQLILNNGEFDVPSKRMEATVPLSPQLTPSYSYDKVTVSVDGASIAEKDNYEVSATFENSSLNSNYELKLIEDTVVTPEVMNIGVENTTDGLSFDFEIVKKGTVSDVVEPIDASISGAKINVSVTENIPLSITTYKNEADKKEPSNDVQTPETVVAEVENSPIIEEKGEIQKFTNSIVTAYVGPALLNQTASEGTNADFITVEWDNVLGANSYVVFRDRYHLINGGTNKDIELVNKISDKYIITLNEDKTVTVKCDDAELDATELSKYVSVKYNGDTNKFTLIDKYRASESTDVGNQWRAGQSEITWGAPNKYTVIPVLSIVDADSASKDSKGIVDINELKIANLKNVVGGTKGYGWNVKATQGTYSASVSKEVTAEKVNDSIEITWTAPYFGNTDKYLIFRKEAYNENAQWERKYMSAAATTNYLDTTVEQGKIYDYAVVNVNYSGNLPDLNFIKSQKKGIDGIENKDSLGFILPKPKISSVSRNDLGINEEEVAFLADVNINSMIDGYVVQVRNNNIDDKWHDIKTIEITPDNVNLTNFTVRVTNDSGLLKVLRDYKHYFRIRAYTSVGTDKIYSKPDETPFTNGMDTDYVRWGCRQISADEFTRSANLLLSQGVRLIWESKGSDPNLTVSTSGGITKTAKFTYKGYNRPSNTKGNVNVSILNATGDLNATYYGSNNPYKYEGTINFACENSSIGMYKGSVKFNADGTMTVNYNTDKDKSYRYDDKEGKFSPLVLGHDGWDTSNVKGYLNDTEAWK